MMYRGGTEYFFPKHSLACHLRYHRERFHDKYYGKERQEQGGVCKHGGTPEGNAQRHRARVSHEESRRVDIEPKEGEKRAHHHPAEDREVEPAQNKRHHRKRHEREKRYAAQKTVQSVCFVGGKRACDNDEHKNRYIPGADRNRAVEGNREHIPFESIIKPPRPDCGKRGVEDELMPPLEPTAPCSSYAQRSQPIVQESDERGDQEGRERKIRFGAIDKVEIFPHSIIKL